MTQRCARCRREAPDQLSDEFTDWEALDETGDEVICPGCITGGEQQAMDMDAMSMHDATLAEQGMVRLYKAASTVAARYVIDHGFSGVPRWAYAEDATPDTGHTVEYVEFRDMPPTGIALSRTTEVETDVHDDQLHIHFDGTMLVDHLGDFILAIDVPADDVREYEIREEPPAGWPFREFWLPPDVANSHLSTLIVFDSNDGAEVRPDLVGR